MAKQLMPRAELEARPGDVPLPDELMLQLSLFAQLKRKPTLDKFPGALVVRRYRARHELFRQGEQGWTAFYILKLEDCLLVYQHLFTRCRYGRRARGDRDRKHLHLGAERLRAPRPVDGVPTQPHARVQSQSRSRARSMFARRVGEPIRVSSPLHRASG